MLKEGKNGKTIEKLYVRSNNIKIITIPVLFEPIENDINGRRKKIMMQSLHSYSNMSIQKKRRNHGMIELFLIQTSNIVFCLKEKKNMSKEEIYEKRIAELIGQKFVEKIKQLPNENE